MSPHHPRFYHMTNDDVYNLRNQLIKFFTLHDLNSRRTMRALKNNDLFSASNLVQWKQKIWFELITPFPTHKKKKVPERQKQFSTMDHSEEISIKNFYRWNVWLKKFQITSFEELINTGFSYESHRCIIMHAEAKWEHADGGA